MALNPKPGPIGYERFGRDSEARPPLPQVQGLCRGLPTLSGLGTRWSHWLGIGAIGLESVFSVKEATQSLHTAGPNPGCTLSHVYAFSGEAFEPLVRKRASAL